MREAFIVVSAIIAGLLTGCSTGAVKNGNEKLSNFVYSPISLEADAKFSETVHFPTRVVSECQQAQFGAGVGASIVLDWLAGKIIGGLKKRVSEAVKKYSAEQSTKEQYFAFYDSEYWWEDSDQTGHISCFVASRQTCAKTDGRDGRCPLHTDVDLAIVGQYRRTAEYLQIRPLWVYKKGMSATFAEGANASLAATLAINSVWIADGRGHKETVFRTPLYSAKFKATTAGQSLKVNIPKWGDVAYQPLPPHSDKITEYSAPIVTIAESSVPPKRLKWLQSFLDDQDSDLSDTLKESLEKLID